MIPVWVEWNQFEPGPQSDKYSVLIRSLGYVLERVGQPELCLPRFHGVYDDLKYEAEHGLKRIGFVFGLPEPEFNHPPPPLQQHQLSYESDLRSYPPRSLKTLIKEGKSIAIPLLGDRFRLAYQLANAFKFLHQANGIGITISNPFITGFQYSRPQGTTSLSRGGLLEDTTLDHYYHPDAHLGFTKTRDLYSLGVVLCEIGRWALVADTVTERRRKQMTSRQAWRDYMVHHVVEDLGWRMGKLYKDAVKALLDSSLPADDAGDAFCAQQLLERVIQPLSMCAA
jgi:hypothetical protein